MLQSFPGLDKSLGKKSVPCFIEKSVPVCFILHLASVRIVSFPIVLISGLETKIYEIIGSLISNLQPTMKAV